METEPWLKREPTTCGCLTCFIATFLPCVVFKCKRSKQKGGGEQAITLHGQKSHVGVQMCSAAALGWGRGGWQVQTLQNLILKSFAEIPILAACLKLHPLN